MDFFGGIRVGKVFIMELINKIAKVNGGYLIFAVGVLLIYNILNQLPFLLKIIFYSIFLF